MRRRSSIRFTFWSGATASSYRSWERVIGAARRIAADTNRGVRVGDDNSGQMCGTSRRAVASQQSLRSRAGIGLVVQEAHVRSTTRVQFGVPVGRSRKTLHGFDAMNAALKERVERARVGRS
jgi:hypothetical protein